MSYMIYLDYVKTGDPEFRWAPVGDKVFDYRIDAENYLHEMSGERSEAFGDQGWREWAVDPDEYPEDYEYMLYYVSNAPEEFERAD